MIISRLFFYFRFGNKNLWRRRSRTMLLGISLTLITIVGILFLGYSQGSSRQMIGGAINNYLGTALIYHSDSKQDVLWPESLVGFDASDLMKELSTHEGLDIRKQYRTKAFTYSGHNQQSLLLIGAEEKYQSKIHIKAGTNLNGPNQILVTAKTAKKLAVTINDTVTCEVVTQDGRRNFDYFQVVGIYQILGLSDLMCNHMAITSISTIHTLMNEPDNMATEIIINKTSRVPDEAILATAQLLTGKAGDRLTVAGWNEYGSTLLAIATTNIVSIWVLWGITMMIVAIFLFDTLLSIVEERKREYGTMMSMGLKYRQISGIFSGEMIMLAFYFVLPGVLAGGLLVNMLARIGIPINNEAAKSIIGGFDRLYPSISPELLGMAFFVLVAFILMISFSAIYKIAKLNPVEVLKNE